jgi:hypothetical protein
MVPHRRILGGGVTCKMRGREGVSAQSAAPSANPAPCARRVATRGKGWGLGGVRACAPRPRPPFQATFVRGCTEGVGDRGKDGAARGRRDGACATGSIRARKALEGRARPPPLLLSSNRLLPHHSGALAGGRLENEHAIGRARWLHRRRHLGIEPPLARPLLACEHRTGQLLSRASRARLGSLESRTGSFIETRCHRERGEERERVRETEQTILSLSVSRETL